MMHEKHAAASGVMMGLAAGAAAGAAGMYLASQNKREIKRTLKPGARGLVGSRGKAPSGV